jgi:hypothetical protein
MTAVSREAEQIQEQVFNHDKHYRALIGWMKRKKMTAYDLCQLFAVGSTVAHGIWNLYDTDEWPKHAGKYRAALIESALGEQWVSVKERLPDFKGRTTGWVPCEFWQEMNEQHFLGWYDPIQKQWLIAHPDYNHKDIEVYDVSHWKKRSVAPPPAEEGSIS